MTSQRAAASAALVVLLTISVAGSNDPEPLIRALAQKDAQGVRALVKAGADVNARRADGATPLLWAAHWNDAASIRVLIAAHADVNAANDLGVTALHLACENASAEIVRALVAAGANVNAAQNSGTTPLMIGARAGNADIVKLLLASGAQVNAATSRTRQTALMWAIADRHRPVVQLLLEAGADPNASASRGFTPLMYTALHGDVDVARILIAGGANVNARGSRGDTALPLAVVAANDEFARFLLEHGADPNGTIGGVGALHAAAAPVDPWLKDWLYSQYEARPTIGLSPSRRLSLVKALLARGANVNQRAAADGTAQYYLAPANGAFDDASMGTGNMRGVTPLFVAMFSPEEPAEPSDPATAVGRVLLAAGADPNAAADDGTTPLMAAAGVTRTGRGRVGASPAAGERARMLLDAGARVDPVNEGKFTALHHAAFAGNEDVINQLVAKGAVLNVQDYRGRTPFRIAEGTKVGFSFVAQPEIARLFEKLGADVTLGPPPDTFDRESRKTIDAPAGRD